MSWTVGQVTGELTINAAASGGVSFGTAPAAGSTVVVLIAAFDNTASDAHGIDSVNDNQGNGEYTRGPEVLASNTFSWATIWYKTNVLSSGTFTVTVTGGDASTNWVKAVCVEAIPTTPSGVTVDLNATNTGTGTAPSVSGGTTTASHEYVAAVMAAANSQGAITGPEGYTERLEFLSGTIQPCEADDKVLTAVGAESPAWTLDISTDWAAVVASFKEAAGGHLGGSFPIKKPSRRPAPFRPGLAR